MIDKHISKTFNSDDFQYNLKQLLKKANTLNINDTTTFIEKQLKDYIVYNSYKNFNNKNKYSFIAVDPFKDNDFRLKNPKIAGKVDQIKEKFKFYDPSKNDHVGFDKTWVYIPLNLMEITLSQMRQNNVEYVDKYESLIREAGKAWIRYHDTKIIKDTNEICVRFGVWPETSSCGNTTDKRTKSGRIKTGEFFYIYMPAFIALDDSIIELMNSTPIKLGLELSLPNSKKENSK